MAARPAIDHDKLDEFAGSQRLDRAEVDRYACQAMVEVASKSRSDVSWIGCGSGEAAGVGVGGMLGVALPTWGGCVELGVGAPEAEGADVGTGCSQSWKRPCRPCGAMYKRLVPSGDHVGCAASCPDTSTWVGPRLLPSKWAISRLANCLPPVQIKASRWPSGERAGCRQLSSIAVSALPCAPALAVR